MIKHIECLRCQGKLCRVSCCLYKLGDQGLPKHRAATLVCKAPLAKDSFPWLRWHQRTMCIRASAVSVQGSRSSVRPLLPFCRVSPRDVRRAQTATRAAKQHIFPTCLPPPPPFALPTTCCRHLTQHYEAKALWGRARTCALLKLLEAAVTGKSNNNNCICYPAADRAD